MRVYFYRIDDGRHALVELLQRLMSFPPTDPRRQVIVDDRLTRLQVLRRNGSMWEMDFARGKDTDLPGKAASNTDIEDLEIDDDERVFDRSAAILYENTFALQFQSSIRLSTVHSYIQKISDQMDVETNVEISPVWRDNLIEKVLDGRFGSVRKLEVTAVPPPSYYRGDHATDVRSFIVAQNDLEAHAVTAVFSARRGDILNQSAMRKFIRNLFRNEEHLKKCNVSIAGMDEPLKLLDWQYRQSIRNDDIDKTPGRQLDFDSRVRAMIEPVRRMGPQK